jgi:hypothetical protein
VVTLLNRPDTADASVAAQYVVTCTWS